MDDDDKPFACTAPGCGMRFTNEDHLTVHKKKHEMSLNLSATNSIKNNSNLFVGSFCDSDQTPTPTRFIRNCEEVGLFQDLQNVNPFEEQFRKAVEVARTGGAAIISETINSGSDPDVLNTPVVIADSLNTPAVLESDLVVSTTTSTENGEILPSTRSSLLQSQTSSAQPSSTTTDSDDEEITVITTSMAMDGSLSSANSLTTNSFLPSHTHVIRCGQARASSLVTQSSLVSTASANTAQVLQIPTVASSAEVPLTTSLPVTSSVAQPTPVIASATTVVQLLLKLPDGRSVPVQIPAVPVVPTAVSVASPVAQSVVATSNVTSLAKMKLKQALTQNQQSTFNISNNTNNNMRVMTEAVEMVTNTKVKVDRESMSSPETKSQLISKRRRTSEEDPDEKRRRFLERNRAAATRCRLKRKQWIHALEQKADELSNANQQLQNDVTLLRNEVAHLKTMLLAHKDCPVTIQQRALGHIDGSQQNHIVLEDVKTIQITSAEAIASTALTNMATVVSEPTHILPVDVIIDSDPMNLIGHIQDNSINDIDK